VCFELHCGEFTATERALLEYYRHRFALPRTLAAYATLQLLPSSQKPILDIACGYGHLAHYLTRRRDPAPVIGIDFNFFQLWGAKQIVAPDAEYACVDVNGALPFIDDAFSSSFCSDAFQFLREKKNLIAELERCAPGKPLILTRVGNRTARPNTGDELSAEEYCDLLGRQTTRAFGEHELIRHYLARRNPLAAPQTLPTALNWDKWLTFVINPSSIQQGEIDQDELWPHAVGELVLNPIFRRQEISPDTWRLVFEFPTIWFAYQNSEKHGYHGNRIECSKELVQTANERRHDPEIHRLLDQFVLLGLPDRYLNAQISPTARRGTGS
jgi:SAM-dependent methyltransferase